MPAIQSIQRGTLVTTSNDASPNATVAITPVNLANAIVMFTSKDTDAQDRDQRHLYSAYLSSASQITFTRFSQNFATNVTIEWEVVEFAAGTLQSLQTGAVNPTAAVTSVPLATAVNPAAAVPLVSLSTNSGTLLYVAPLPAVTQTTAPGDTLTFTLPSTPVAGTYNCRWQLIEFKSTDASVQTGVTTFGADGAYNATQSIASVDLTKTLVAAYHYGGSTTSDCRQSLRYYPTSPTALRFDTQPTGAMAAMSVRWYVVTLLDGSTVQTGGFALTASQLTPTTQPAWPAMSQGSMWSPHQYGNAFLTDGTNGDPQDSHLAYRFNSTQNGASVSRGGSLAPIEAYYQAVDWVSSGGATSTPTTVSVGTGAETSTGQGAALVQPTTVSARAGAESSSGQGATVVQPTTITASTGSEVGVGQVASASNPTNIASGTGSETSAGPAATVSIAVSVAANAGSESSTGQGATVSNPGNVVAGTGGGTDVGHGAAISNPTNVTAAVGTSGTTGQAVTINSGSGIAAGAGGSTSSGQAAAVSNPANIVVGVAGNAGTGNAAQVVMPTNVAAGSGAMSSAGSSATVSTGAAGGTSSQVLPNPKRTYLAQPRVREYVASRRVREASEGTMNYSPIRVGERDVFTANYTPLLRPDEAISKAVWSATVVRGVDSNPTAMFQSDPAIAGPKVSQMIAPVVPGITYRIICTAQTSFGRELILPDPGRDELYVPS